VRPDAAFPHMRAGDALHHPWKYLRRDVPHIWYADERFPLMGFLNRDEATLLHNIALQFAGKRALEIGSWLGWSTAHLALAGVEVDVIDPAHDEPEIRRSVEASLVACGVRDRVNLAGGQSPESIASFGRKWDLFFIDGDHESPGPFRDALACLPYANRDCAFVLHDHAAPAVADGVRALAERGFHVVVYRTAQIMAMAWRGDVRPVMHLPDPDVAWQDPPHLAGLPVCDAGYRPPARESYPLLRDLRFDGQRATPSVCIVTSEIIGPFKNGGIGTAMTGLAEMLAADGLRVTLLYTASINSPDVDLRPWTTHYADRGIELESLSVADLQTIAGPVRDRGYYVPSLVYRFLESRRFDVIHFNDCCGEGNLVFAAKKLGIAFEDSLLVLALHSPSRWVIDLNQTLPNAPVLAAYHYGERISMRGADVAWSPSRYLLDWIAQRDYELPPQTFLQQYVMPGERPSAPAYGRTSAPKEIVFFGRLEERKGLRTFCNAIHLLRDELAQRNVAVTFLGKPARCAGMPSLDYIKRRAESWTFPVTTLTDFGQPEALWYLTGVRSPNGKTRDARAPVIAVIASPVDNSPCTIYEALENGIPFLATRTGGVPELIDAADADRVLFENTTESLRDALHGAIENGGWIARPAVPQQESRRAWSDFHAHWRTMLPAPVRATRPAHFTAIIDHRAPGKLTPTLLSLAKCPSIARYVVINREDEPMPFPVIDLLTQDPEALHLESIAEEAVLLIHSGVTVDADALESMLDALADPTIYGLVPPRRAASGRFRRSAAAPRFRCSKASRSRARCSCVATRSSPPRAGASDRRRARSWDSPTSASRRTIASGRIRRSSSIAARSSRSFAARCPRASARTAMRRSPIVTTCSRPDSARRIARAPATRIARFSSPLPTSALRRSRASAPPSRAVSAVS